jgi:hypothetical protein
MLSQLLGFLGTSTDVRSVAAIVLGVLTTVVGHNSTIVKSVVDGVAGLIVLVDTYQSHKTKQAVIAASVKPVVATWRSPGTPVPVQVVPSAPPVAQQTAG